MLKVENVNLFYGAAQALRGVSLTAEIGKVTWAATASARRR
jgi:urea transport system ATP-binding protein